MRALLCLAATVAGLVALLGFKSEARPVASSGPLPAASLPASTPTAGSSPPHPSGSASSSGSSTASSAATKRYVGASVQTQYGIVQVAVVVSGHTIRSVSFVQLQAFDGHSQQINSMAAPQLLQETITAQSANVDTVSGATYTSDGYRQSLQSALDQAGIR